jgi:hypothetical protein
MDQRDQAMTWPGTTIHVDDGTCVGIGLPPGWWSLPTSGPDLPARAREVADNRPIEAPGFADELVKLARVGALSGAILLAGGAAADDDTGQVVSASLLVIPDSTGDTDPPAGTEEGPSARLELPAGATVRRLFVGSAPSPLGDIYQLKAQYVVVTGTRPWLLSFQTPAVGHAHELLEVFDGIAATLRIENAAEPAGSAFG